jgi:site-specific DNA-adenine methylase
MPIVNPFKEETRTPLSKEELERRRKAVDFARASVEMEGLYASEEFNEMMERHANGEISSEELDEFMENRIKEQDSCRATTSKERIMRTDSELFAKVNKSGIMSIADINAQYETVLETLADYAGYLYHEIREEEQKSEPDTERLAELRQTYESVWDDKRCPLTQDVVERALTIYAPRLKKMYEALRRAPTQESEAPRFDRR